ncbi:MAG: oxidoreductase [Pirellulaceae bacterium]|nr:MAG: oxidoreductase [Pirellulaceae bacterium]
MGKLEGKTALVTGGGSGIGLAIARALASEQCRVVICGRREQQLRKAAEAYPCNPPLQWRSVDVADRRAVQQLFEWLGQQNALPNILVNAAGINIRNRTMAQMTPEQWDAVLAVNVTGAYNCMYYALPVMRSRGEGLVINISSIAGKRASQLGGVAYSASKFAMTALGLCVANEDNRHGIRVTNVYPGEVDTPILDHRPEPVSDEHRRAILQPEDVAQLVLAIALLPAKAHVPEVIIKPLGQNYA